MKALITGGTSGIGAAYAMAFAKQKYDLVLVSLNIPSEASFLINTLEKKYGINVTVVQADLTKEKDIQKIVRFIKKARRKKPITRFTIRLTQEMGDYLNFLKVKMKCSSKNDVVLKIIEQKMKEDYHFLKNI